MAPKMMIAYIGQALLGVAMILAGLQAFWAKAPARHLAYGQALFVAIAFLFLLYAHVTDQFSLLSVVMHSHTQKPLLYKISGVWGNHEGSMLLWVLILTVYGAFVARQLRTKPTPYTLAAPLFGLISFSFLAFLILACDPFAIANPIPLEGQDLNPLLQDPSLAIHPPCLYLGYVGFVVPFVFGMTLLFHKKEIPPDWSQLLYPWVLFAWTFLTLGIGLGSFWAYYELGWGGWWFWDPVENAALMPWLSATALLHAVRVYDRTQSLRVWTLFLCLLTFTFCLFGTFLVRSNLLTSVHSFAVDPERGAFILILCAFIVIPAFALFLVRATGLKSSTMTVPLSRSGLMLLMNLILISGMTTVAFGTLYPLVLEVFGQRITVGAPYYHLTFIPMMLPVLILLGLGPWYDWTGAPESLQRWLLPLFSCTVVFVLALSIGAGIRHLLGLLALGGAIWVILSTLTYAARTRQFLSGMVLSHVGVGVMVLGIVGSSLGEQEIIKAAKIGDVFAFGPYELTLEKVLKKEGPNYMAQGAVLEAVRGGTHKILTPEKRFYWTQGVIHGESSIKSFGLDHLYVTLGEEYEGNRWSIHAYHKPYINLLWVGALMIVLGGMVGMARRWAAAMMLLMLLSPADAIDAHEQLGDPGLEVRARHLSQIILCPVCQGQTLDESQVETAVLLRDQIRVALVQGQSDQQILDDFVARFGDQVVITPRMTLSTYALWVGPWVLFLGLGGGIWCKVRRRRMSSS